MIAAKKRPQTLLMMVLSIASYDGDVFVGKILCQIKVAKGLKWLCFQHYISERIMARWGPAHMRQ